MIDRLKHRSVRQWFLLGLLVLPMASAWSGTSILFIGNSFSFAWGSPVRYYRANTVTDLNHLGIGGVPALLKSFTDQAGLDWDVYLETQPGVGIDWHFDNKLSTLGQRPFDKVTMMGFSTMDPKKPGDPTVLIQSAKAMAEYLHSRNPQVDIQLEATFPRADQVYDAKGAWYGKTIEDMVRDVRAGNDKAAAIHPAIKGVVPVGEAWQRAIQTGVADRNPYDGIDAGKVNLWTYDHYHASMYGYYLKALVMFGHFTGRDPRSLGPNECSGFELGFSVAQVLALQQVAFDQLASSRGLQPAPFQPSGKEAPQRCQSKR
jgi:hypothetical protein